MAIPFVYGTYLKRLETISINA